MTAAGIREIGEKFWFGHVGKESSSGINVSRIIACAQLRSQPKTPQGKTSPTMDRRITRMGVSHNRTI